MKVSLAQINSKLGAFDQNKAKIRSAIARAKEEGANLLILPFGALTGFPIGNLLASKDFRNTAKAALEDLALETKNESLVVFAGGDEVFENGEVRGAQTNPESQRGGYSFLGFGSRSMEVVVNLGPKIFEKNRPEAYELELRLMAGEKKAWVFDVNLAGATDEIVFSGLSSVFTPDGSLFCRLKFTQEDFITVNLEEPSPARIEEIPAGEDILIRAAVQGIRDYFAKNNFQKILVSLSGGIDSALVLWLAVQAVGAERVEALTLPSRHSSPHSAEDARQLCGNLSVPLKEISIEPFHSLYEAQLHSFGEGLWQENIQARIRGNIVMSLSNSQNMLVLACGNKSEAAVGYSTLYGDTCGGLAPIGDLLKTEVRAMCRFVNRQGPIIPERILTRPPSAELRPNQTDEESLPDYGFLDRVLYLHCEEGQDFQEISQQLGRPEDVHRILSLLYRSEYKRRQGAIVLKMSKRHFGLDWQIPASASPWF